MNHETNIPEINLSDFSFELPKELIAEFPKKERDHSKLLIFDGKNVNHRHFYSLSDYINKDATIFFNNTKVIPARIEFFKETGARIEIFLTEPVYPSKEVNQVMSCTKKASWKCMIGNLKKWKEGKLQINLEGSLGKTTLSATLSDRTNSIVEFKWGEEITFSEVLQAIGETPLPPYIQRKAVASDRSTYQTVYSKHEGAVAAPTAGLHFTEHLLGNLKSKGCKLSYLTLHVSAGTFQPISVKKVEDHNMHSERIEVSKQNIFDILYKKREIVAVGTTSVRTLESLYWYGVKLEKNPHSELFIEKLFPYRCAEKLSLEKSMRNIIEYMDQNRLEVLSGVTEIFIIPGYKFNVVDRLITNFHMPGSTLVLLIAAFIGENWKKVYESALTNQYRFLSYGDSSLLFRSE